MDDLLASAFRQQYRRIYDYVRRSGSSHAEAEEITQEVFAQAAARLDRLSTDARPIAAWLYTVARRRLVDEARRRSRAARAALSLVPLSAEVPAYGGDVARALRLALETLPEAQRQVIVLKLLAGRTFAEIAELVGTTEAASRMRFSRGLELLRDELEREGMSP